MYPWEQLQVDSFPIIRHSMKRGIFNMLKTFKSHWFPYYIKCDWSIFLLLSNLHHNMCMKYVNVSAPAWYLLQVHCVGGPLCGKLHCHHSLGGQMLYSELSRWCWLPVWHYSPPSAQQWRHLLQQHDIQYHFYSMCSSNLSSLYFEQLSRGDTFKMQISRWWRLCREVTHLLLQPAMERTGRIKNYSLCSR